MLLVLQAVIVAPAAWPAYRLGTRAQDPRAGAAARRRAPALPGSASWCSTSSTRSPWRRRFLLWAFLYLEEDRLAGARPSSSSRPLCKEDRAAGDRLHGRVLRAAQAVVAAADRHGRRRAVYFAIAVWVIIPHFNGTEPFIARYGDYGRAPERW